VKTRTKLSMIKILIQLKIFNLKNNSAWMLLGKVFPFNLSTEEKTTFFHIQKFKHCAK